MHYFLYNYLLLIGKPCFGLLVRLGILNRPKSDVNLASVRVCRKEIVAVLPVSQGWINNTVLKLLVLGKHLFLLKHGHKAL